MPTSVAIIGTSGYSGAELARLVALCPTFQLTAAYSDRQQGEPLGNALGGLGAAGALIVRPQAEAFQAYEHAKIIALATPAEVSIRLAGTLIAGGARVIDLSGAFRIPDPAVFKRYYGFEHTAPELLAEARYALPQIPAAAGKLSPAMKQTRLVSNPGCYATATILALAPLLHHRLIEPHGIFVDGKSGVSGAGRKLLERFLFMEIAENLSAYRVTDHQHTPEIELSLSRVADCAVTVTFAPHLLPIRRGLIATCYARAVAGIDLQDVRASVENYYAGQATLAGDPVVTVGSVEEASVASVSGTPRARIGVAIDQRTRGVVVAGALDNLLKGAASQALENMLAMVDATP